MDVSCDKNEQVRKSVQAVTKSGEMVSCLQELAPVYIAGDAL